MSLRVNYNPASVRTHQHLAAADRAVARTLERLSSGQRINRSSDDPSGMVSANAIRHNLEGITQASQNIEEGVSMLQSADGAMDTISSLLIRLRSLALSAANEGANGAAQLKALQSEFDEAARSITRVAQQARYGTIPLLDGTLSNLTLADSAKTEWSDASWDATRLPGGLKEGTTLDIAPPAQTRSTVSAKFYGNPPLSTAIQGLNQNGNVLDNVAGRTVTITGPLGGPQVYTLAANTTLGEFVAQVNSTTQTTGVRASYDAARGELDVATVGPGTVTLAAQDMTITGTTNIGFLDGNTAGINPFMAATGDHQRERFEVVLSTGALPTAPFPARTTALSGLRQNGTTLTVAGGEQVTITGSRGTSVITLPSGVTVGDFVDLVNLQTSTTGARASYDANSGSLAVENIAFGAGTLNVSGPDLTGGGNIGLLNPNTTTATSNPFRSPRDTFAVTLSKPGSGAPMSATDLVAGLAQSIGGPAGAPFAQVAGKRFTIFGNGESASMDLLANQSAADVAAHLASVAGGTFVASSGLLTIGAANMTVTAGTSWHQIAGWATANTAWTTAINGTTMTTTNGVINDSYALSGTSIQDVLDFVNQHGTDLGTSASFNAGTGALTLTSLKGPIHLTSDDLTGVGLNEGLLDRNVIDPLDTGGTRTVTGYNATVDLTWTDELGNLHTVPLSQLPGQGDGLVFANLNAGPGSGPPFSLWEAGAFRITAADSSAGTMGLTATAATTTRESSRLSRTWIQTGGFTGQRVNVEIRDMRAGALGRSAMQAELMGGAVTGTLLTQRGYDSIDDLVREQALVDGDSQLAIHVIDAAIDEVSTARGRTGALQANSLESTLESLRIAIQNLTDSESRIRDTDFAQESADFARNNIIYQAATAMLAQANQVPQTVLGLLK